MNTAQSLNVDTDELWEKVGVPLIEEATGISSEERALQIVESGVLTSGEIALMILMSMDNIFEVED